MFRELCMETFQTTNFFSRRRRRHSFRIFGPWSVLSHSEREALKFFWQFFHVVNNQCLSLGRNFECNEPEVIIMTRARARQKRRKRDGAQSTVNRWAFSNVISPSLGTIWLMYRSITEIIFCASCTSAVHPIIKTKCNESSRAKRAHAFCLLFSCHSFIIDCHCEHMVPSSKTEYEGTQNIQTEHSLRETMAK